jgi:murein DD-endopeptidase MepM/ murein hydrolase activator NlpD
MIKLFSIKLLSLILFCSVCHTEPFRLSWPTPNPSFAQGLGYSTFLQKTGPEKAYSSGAFGCVRNNGYKFHEGVDLFPVKRDKAGKAEDKVFAAMQGVVSYINEIKSYSAYGKYIVLEHPSCKPPLYSLYAHLSEVSAKLKVGSKVDVAEPIGVMGNTSSFHIPVSRSHLHFEMGLRLSDDFQKWFDSKEFKTPNRHGNYSGYNLVGIDPLHFFSQYKKKPFEQPLYWIKTLPTILKVRVKSSKFVDFGKRYPDLCPNFDPQATTWDCSMGPYGIPLRIEPAEKAAEGDKRIQILSYDLHANDKPCRNLVIRKGSHYQPSEQLKSYIEILFGN